MENHYLEHELYELVSTDRNIFTFIQDAALDGMWYLDLENTEEEWMNKKFWTVLGYDPMQMPHKSSSWKNIVNQDDYKITLQKLAEHLKNPEHPYDQVLRYTHAKGYTKWIRCRGFAIRNKNGDLTRMLGAHIDITDVMEEKEQLSRCNEQANIGYWKVDLVNDTVHWSSMVKKIIGVSQDFEPSVDKTYTFLSDETKDILEQTFQDAVELGKPYDVNVKVKRLDGQERWVRSVGFPKMHEGKCIYVYGTWQDIHEHRDLSLQKEKAIKMLNNQNQRLQNFAHIVSHNLRSYVSGIKGLIDIIEDQGFDNSLDYFKHFNVSVNNLDNTLKELVNVVDVEVSKPIKAVQIDLREEIHNALVILGLNAKTTGVQLINEVSNGVKLYVIKPYFISVITNLITNAIKYSDPLKKSYLKITSRPISKEGLLEIVFEDNGIGIDLIKNRDKLFTLYGTFISNKESRGVGLYLASNQIELMNGSIDVESEIGVGSSFIIKLPIDC